MEWQQTHGKVLPSPQSDHRVLGHLPDKVPSPPIAQFGRAASAKKSLGDLIQTAVWLSKS